MAVQRKKPQCYGPPVDNIGKQALQRQGRSMIHRNKERQVIGLYQAAVDQTALWQSESFHYGREQAQTRETENGRTGDYCSRGSKDDMLSSSAPETQSLQGT